MVHEMEKERDESDDGRRKGKPEDEKNEGRPWPRGRGEEGGGRIERKEAYPRRSSPQHFPSLFSAESPPPLHFDPRLFHSHKDPLQETISKMQTRTIEE